jgi:hypothetical protein
LWPRREVQPSWTTFAEHVMWGLFKSLAFNVKVVGA